jgi:uncharacterized protein YjbJ (UPF0337 family)
MAEEQNDEGLPNADEMKGRAKEAAGALGDDDDLRKEGKIDRAVSGVKEKVDAAADKVKDLVDGDDDRQR